MKDVIITAKRQKRELIIFGVCLLLSFALNIGAVIYYESPWTEVFTSLFYVITFAVATYAVLAVIRLIAAVIMGTKKKK